jgi:tetratricopeptide (TPR) repeat protein
MGTGCQQASRRYRLWGIMVSLRAHRWRGRLSYGARCAGWRRQETACLVRANMKLGFGFYRKALVIAVGAMLLTQARHAWSANACARCHPKEAAGYSATPMAHSSGPPRPEPSATFVHAVSGTTFSAQSRGSQLVQRIERNGISADYEMAYAIGSGSHATGYLIEIGRHLFQSPLTYYAGHGWGMSPGYEDNRAPDFDRPIKLHCLFCHAGEARPVPGTLNTYEDPPFAAERITCERCHGPVEAHLRNPVAGSIVNPARLPVAARDSVCEQCHLAGEAFILNPGKEYTDFRPGENLADVFAVYVFPSSRDPNHPNALTVISQSQQLALSRCARMSNGKLWCGTCHNPHQQPPNPVAYIRSRCLSCHGAAILKTHPKPDRDCVRCHMPRLPVTGGGHTIFTDHRIAIYTAQELARKGAPTGATPGHGEQNLVAWRQPATAFRQRDLGLAEVQVGERVKSFDLVNSGFKLLLACWPKFPNDPALLTAIGQVLLGEGDARDAERLFQRVIKLVPNDAANYVHAGLAWHAQHDDALAIACFNKALQIDPLVQQPYRNLAQVYAQQDNLAMLRQTYERFLKAFPKSLEAQSDSQKVGRLVLMPAAN